MQIEAQFEVPSKVAESIQCYKIKHPFMLPDSRVRQHFGVDPGTVNIGLAEFGRANIITAFQIKMKRENDAVDRVKNFYAVMSECFHSFIIPSFMVIEGASYGDRYRQVELAEVRASAIFWGIHKQINSVRVYPPQSIRKLVFGSAKKSVKNFYEGIPLDCGAAIACAYASMSLHWFYPNTKV